MRRSSQIRRLLGEPLEGGGVAPLEDVDNGIEPLVELAVEVVRDRESRARTGLLALTQSTQSCMRAPVRVAEGEGPVGLAPDSLFFKLDRASYGGNNTWTLWHDDVAVGTAPIGCE